MAGAAGRRRRKPAFGEQGFVGLAGGFADIDLLPAGILRAVELQQIVAALQKIVTAFEKVVAAFEKVVAAFQQVVARFGLGNLRPSEMVRPKDRHGGARGYRRDKNNLK
jgi:hypothetical protein